MRSKVLSKSKILLTHAAFLQISSYIARPAAIYKAIELDSNDRIANKNKGITL
jgi:hypothetical protein